MFTRYAARRGFSAEKRKKKKEEEEEDGKRSRGK